MMAVYRTRMGRNGRGRRVSDTLDTEPLLDMWIPGKAAPGGSKKAFRHASTGKIVVMDDAKGNRDWKGRVSALASAVWLVSPISGPLAVWMEFRIARPKYHYRGTSGEVKATAPCHPTGKPDATKLLRACEDALTGVVWLDDAQIVSQHVTKIYADAPGVRVVVRRVDPC